MIKQSKFKYFISRHRVVLLISIATLLLISGGAYYWFSIDQQRRASRTELTTTTQPEAPITKPALLTGVEVDPSIANRQITGVMIENSPEARPQTGLDKAGIIFEAVAEGGITRFLTLFQENNPDTLGPVRSLRPYYLDWLMGFDASVAHVGGSAKALNLVRTRNGKDLDQFRYSAPYYRTTDRFAPHNVYTSIADLRALEKKLGFTSSKVEPFARSEDKPSPDPTATRITIDYSAPLYVAQFRYRKASNDYERYLAGAPHVDRKTNKILTTKNLVVIKMPTTYDGSYAVMQTIGKGEALVFKDGVVQKATWRQQSFKQRIELLDSENKPVELNVGNTWFAVLPSGRSLDY